MANLREEQDLSKDEVGQYWQSSSLGKLDYIPQEALENLEWYTTFWDDMEKLDKVIKLDELKGERKTQENPSFNVSSVQINHQRICSDSETKETTQKPLRRTKVKSCSIKKSRAKKFIGERSCSHCETKETTQWREGPLGKNSLCNACGLRYKLNGLVKGYRPKASPAFDIRNHSNLHKKVMGKE
ncbi:GATA transcription factor 3 [Medicago truncatula]|uniref:GATA type zinc finger transcription factor family protein n=2 Tax=Medicago truncatula TaxID=3880 RepID=A0A072TYA0_MEDTR|nr:GATA transcription factor 3 [Medicago truncatula]KEH22382.1 GATA type zinc finger transcription factor family protein [Medicago truncatula]